MSARNAHVYVAVVAKELREIDSSTDRLLAWNGVPTASVAARVRTADRRHRRRTRKPRPRRRRMTIADLEAQGRCPACGGRKATWGPAAIIAALTDWATRHGRAPTAGEWHRGTPGYPANTTVARVFGSWNNGLAAAGLTPVRPGGRRNGRWDEKQMKHALLVWIFKHGRKPGYRDWAHTDPAGERPTSGQAQRMFGSWNAFLVAAGYEPTVSHRTAEGYQRQAGAATRARVAA